MFLFQENKSYDVKTICIDPLSTRCCTSRREQYLYPNFNIFLLILCVLHNKVQRLSLETESIVQILPLSMNLFSYVCSGRISTEWWWAPGPATCVPTSPHNTSVQVHISLSDYFVHMHISI
jgi:hypothetical protein